MSKLIELVHKREHKNCPQHPLIILQMEVAGGVKANNEERKTLLHLKAVSL
jgi:hypothetical protein